MGYLNSVRDVFGVPFYPVVFQILMVLTFAIHIIFVNLVVGGTAVAIWGRLKGSDYSLRISRAFARTNTIATSLAIVVGVAPLLFVQVIYDPFWYTAGNISAWWTLLFLVGIAAAFTFAYLFYLPEKGGSLFWAIASLVSLLFVAAVIHMLVMEQLHPEMWKRWIVQGSRVNLSGWGFHAFNIVRFLHFLIPSLAVAGIYMMLYGWYFKGKYSDSYTSWAAQTGAKLALYASCAQGLVGIVWLATEPARFIFHPVTILGVLAAASFIGYLFKVQRDPVKSAVPTAAFAFVAVLLMSTARELLRFLKLSSAGYSLYSYKMSLSWGSTALFFATFIMGLVVIAYPMAVTFKAGRAKEEGTLRLEELDGFGKLAAALPVVWFVVVATLGVVISLKNGTLF